MRVRILLGLAMVACAVLGWGGVVASRMLALSQRIAVLESLPFHDEERWSEAIEAARWIAARGAVEGVPALRSALEATRHIAVQEAAIEALSRLGPTGIAAAERYLFKCVRSGEDADWALLQLSQRGQISQVSTHELCGVLAGTEWDPAEEVGQAALIARGAVVVGEVTASCAAVKFEHRASLIAVLRHFRAEAVSWIDARLQAAASQKEMTQLREIRDELVPGGRSESLETE